MAPEVEELIPYMGRRQLTSLLQNYVSFYILSYTHLYIFFLFPYFSFSKNT